MVNVSLKVANPPIRRVEADLLADMKRVRGVDGGIEEHVDLNVDKKTTMKAEYRSLASGFLDDIACKQNLE